MSEEKEGSRGDSKEGSHRGSQGGRSRGDGVRVELEDVMRSLAEQGRSPTEMRIELLGKGYLEDEVEAALGEHVRKHRSVAERKANAQLTVKELLDRIGYGFVSPQFINILFWQTGVGFFLIGLFNGLKVIISLLSSSVLQEYSKLHTVPKNKIATAGILFGFSFFLMAYARLARIPWLFALAFLISAAGIVTYGDLYNRLVKELLKHERRNHFLRQSAQYGVIITSLSLLASGILIDRLPGTIITVAGMRFKLYGFLLSFMITAFAFIIGGYVISVINDRREQKRYAFLLFLGHHYRSLKTQARAFLGHKHVQLLLFATIITGLLQVLGASYYGIFIYQTFQHSLYGGFTNVAVLYTIAVLASLFGPFFTKGVERSTGLAPHLVFGTLLTAFLPLVLIYNPHFLAVAAALVCSVIGAAIVGVAQGLIAQKIMDEKTRKAFFVTQAFLVAIPYLLLVPVGAWLAQTYGLELLFRIVVVGLVAVVAPIYLVLVATTSKHGL